MSKRPVRYCVQEILYYLDGNFTIPDDTFESDIKGFGSDNDDDLKHKCCLRSQMVSRNVINEDEEA